MKTKSAIKGLFIIILVFGSINLYGQNFSRRFNADYPVYGFDLLGYAKSPTVRDLTLPDNFMNTGNQRITVEEMSLNKDGDEYTIKLLLTNGINRRARFEIKLKTDDRAGRNYITAVSLYDFNTRRKEHISYSGREERIAQILTRYIELMDMFYNKQKLLS
jgi:hypothetical protein